MISNERKLIKECLNGKRRAQQRLYDQFAGTLYAVSLRYARCTDDAGDILQEGFTRIFTNLDQYKFDGSFEGWMKRVVVNCALAYYRKKNAVIYVEEYYDSNPNVMISGHALEELSTQELRSIISDLPDGYRTVFNLYAIEGFSHKEIAAQLGISVGTSKSQLSDARKQLRQKIKEREIIRI